jgi:hypothetical protein
MPMEPQDLPGSRTCVGCGGLTFRNREDGLCPRCAFQAESLIEQIELDGLERDLALMTRFEAYCRQRDMAVEAAEAHAASRVREPFAGAVGDPFASPTAGQAARPFEGREPDYPAAAPVRNLFSDHERRPA